MRAGAADAAGVGRHRAVVQAQAVEYAAIGIVHIAVGLFQRFIIGVERIGIFHDKFAGAHHAETRAYFITEFGLDVVEVFRQLFVARDFFAHDVGNHLFAGGAHAEIALVAVFDAQQFFAVKLPAAGFLPQLGRLDYRHQQFHTAGFVHLFAHDVFHFAQNAQAHRHPSIQAGSHRFDQAGAYH